VAAKVEGERTTWVGSMREQGDVDSFFFFFILIRFTFVRFRRDALFFLFLIWVLVRCV